MKEFLKRSGIIFILLGIILLGYKELSSIENNILLALSGGLILLGFLLYVILNNILD
jgi:hypothetical protein